MYSDAERAAGQRTMILEGVFSRAMEGVTGGVILAGFAIALGATDFEIGLLAAIPFLAQLAHIPAVGILARTATAKPLVVGSAVFARVLFFVIATLPLLSLPLRPVAALVPLLVAYAFISTLAGAGWQVWVRELVPRESLGGYFGRRLAILSGVGLVTLLAAGLYVSRADEPLLAYATLYAIGGAAGLVSAIILSRAPCVATRIKPVVGFPSSLIVPFRDPNYRRVLIFLGAWSFAANVALPFISVVLLTRMGYGVGLVTLLAALSQLANIGGLRLWAPLTDRFGNKPVLALSASVFLVAMALWAFTQKDATTTTIAIAGLVHVLLGFSVAGLDIASNGLVMKLAAEGEAPSYLASASVVKALAAGIAPLLAGLAATLLSPRPFHADLTWASPGGERAFRAIEFVGHDFLFLASVVLGLYAIHRLLAFREEGEAPPTTVMRAMRREVGTVGSVAGMRAFAHAASYVVEAAYRFERSLDVRRLMDVDDDEPGEKDSSRARSLEDR